MFKHVWRFVLRHHLLIDRWKVSRGFDGTPTQPKFPGSESRLFKYRQHQAGLDKKTLTWFVFSMVVISRIFPARTFFTLNTPSGVCFDSQSLRAAHSHLIFAVHVNSRGALKVENLEWRTSADSVWCYRCTFPSFSLLVPLWDSMQSLQDNWKRFLNPGWVQGKLCHFCATSGIAKCSNILSISWRKP